MQIAIDAPFEAVSKCIVLTKEIDQKLSKLVKRHPGTNKSMLIRKILEAYFAENGI